MKKRFLTCILCVSLIFSNIIQNGIVVHANEETVELTEEPTETPEEVDEPTEEPEETPEVTAEPSEEAEEASEETPEVTAEPSEEAEEPEETPEVTAEPSKVPEMTTEPSETPEATAEPTKMPVETATPTPSVMPKEPAVSELSPQTANGTVSDADGLNTALSNNQSVIVISGVITVGEEADDSGKMLPLVIPAGTTIKGETTASGLDCRCPIQIGGDGVILQDMVLQFSSSTALGSVAHREIFLAGHSLTLDNVDTYLEGSGGSLGGLGGSEDELLPTVYAGGFEDTTVGNAASLTIQNANSSTVFQGIYMSHDGGSDAKVAYTGEAIVGLGAGTSVRDGIYTESNSNVQINMSGSGASSDRVSDVLFYGNADTTINIENFYSYRIGVHNVGDINLKNNAYLEMTQGELGNVTLQGNSVLDLNSMTDVTVTGNFIGESYESGSQTDKRGILVLNEAGSLNIQGTVDGVTLFHTDNRNFPGDYEADKKYIKATKVVSGAVGFMLPDSKADSYSLQYETDGYVVSSVYVEEEYPEVTSIEIVSAPDVIDVSKIRSTGYVPNSEAPYCEIIWKDTEGNALTEDDIFDLYLYEYGAVIAIKTEYWEDDNAATQTDWGNFVQFVTLESEPGKYYFYLGQSSDVNLGKYTFLFCSEYYYGDLNTVADVKSIKNIIKAELDITLYDSTDDTNPIETPTSTAMPTATPSATPTVAPTATVTPSIAPTPTATAEPSPTLTPTIAPTVAPTPQPEGLRIKAIPNYTYTGKAIKPVVEVYEGDVLLTKKDYSVSYKNNTKAGTATVIVKGKGNYTGSDMTTFVIEPKSLDAEDITVTNVSAVIKKGVVKNPKVTVKFGKKTLAASTATKVKDYSFTWPELEKDENGNVVKQSHEITVIGQGNYTGETTFTYDVLETEIKLMSKVKITPTFKTIDYFNQQIPEFKLTYGSGKTIQTLVAGEDYEITYPETIVVGKNIVTFEAIEGSGFYGTKAYTLTTKGKSIKAKGITVEGIAPNYNYTGSEIRIGKDGLNTLQIKDTLQLEDGNPTLLKENEDYTVSYKKNINAGTATVIITGINGYTGSRKATFKINKIPLSEELIEVAESAVYNKNGAKPIVSGEYNSILLTEKKDYTLSYKNNKKLGENTATVTIKGKGNFSGSLVKSYSVTASEAKSVTFTVSDTLVPTKVSKLKPKISVLETETKKKLTAGKDYHKVIQYFVPDENDNLRPIADADLKADTVVTARLTILNNSLYDQNHEDDTPIIIDTTFRLYAIKASTLKVDRIPNQVYTGKEIKPTLIVKLSDGTVLSEYDEDTKTGDYVVTYTKNIKVGTAKATITGVSNRLGGSKAVSFKIVKKPVKLSLMESLKLFFS